MLIYQRVRVRTRSGDGRILLALRTLDNAEIEQHLHLLPIFPMEHTQTLHHLQNQPQQRLTTSCGNPAREKQSETMIF